jgi:DNA-binding GntR family transcriptional regulator
VKSQDKQLGSADHGENRPAPERADVESIEPIRFDSGEVSSIADVVYRRLKQAIVAGAFAPGERMSERSIATRLGTSTTPIKRALHRLHVEGLVEIRPRKGTFVSEFDPANLEENSMVRATLEGLAARFAAQKATDADRAAIAAQIEEMRRYTTQHDRDAMIDSNYRFHLVIHDTARNPYVKQLLSVLRGLDRSVRTRALIDEREADVGFAEHRQIADAVISGNAELAEQQMKRHILRTSKDLVSRVAHGPQGRRISVETQ